MIGYLSGKVLLADESAHSLLIDVGGVGYQLLVPVRLLAGLLPGKTIEVFVVTHLRENALELFGFSNGWEKKVFLALTSVSGIGPRTALGVLGSLEPEAILSAIMREDKATLTNISGIGKKTAERLVMELSDKVQKLLAEKPQAGQTQVPAAGTSKSLPSGGSAKNVSTVQPTDLTELWHEALGALVNLGYRESDALSAIRQASQELSGTTGTALPELIRSSLQCMARIRGING